MSFFAHTAPPGHPWEPLDKHLDRVSGLARQFADSFDSGQWARLAGLWHDLGKYSDAFQGYLKKSASGHSPCSPVDHSSAGAQHALDCFGKKGKDTIASIVLAYLIVSHHGGLRNWRDTGPGGSVRQRLDKSIEPWRSNVPSGLLNQECPLPPSLPRTGQNQRQMLRISLWIRMLFSSLCDADFIATEEFMDPQRSKSRPATVTPLTGLRDALDHHLDALTRGAAKTRVNKVRKEVLDYCRSVANAKPGFFTLAVPTGGGKTLSSMSFALRHACHNGQRRVIVAIPFTSIIEQNAQVYRRILAQHDPNVVLEHHSDLDPTNGETVTARLQSENWDAPVVVTTNVQFFESLFAARTSRCRKLHRIARSVIILDEVQSLPVDLLQPTIYALRDLVEVYGCTVVLCSATQPALTHRKGFEIGIPSTSLTPIIPLNAGLHKKLQRTVVKHAGQLDDDELWKRIRDEDQVLCIVNTTAHASRLAARIGREQSHFHLSSRMCPAHRLCVLKAIRGRLKRGEECRLVSTQLVEAGVDLDFATVYRAPCGLDALAQAAGRCNREGKQAGMGQVVSFDSAELPPLGHLRRTAQIGREVLCDHLKDPLAPAAIDAYFRHHYWACSDQWDAQGVLANDVLPTVRSAVLKNGFQFATMAQRYRIIREETCDLIVPWREDGRHLVDRFLRSSPPDRSTLRLAQRYTVGVRSHVRDRLDAQGGLCESHGYALLTDESLYDEQLGLLLEKVTGRRSPEDNII